MCYRACRGTIDRTAFTEKYPLPDGGGTPLGMLHRQGGGSLYVNDLQRELGVS